MFGFNNYPYSKPSKDPGFYGYQHKNKNYNNEEKDLLPFNKTSKLS